MALLAPVAWLALGMTVPLSGTVVDAAGRPVAGATVWLGDTVATRKGPEVLATAETDDRGHFRLERAADLSGRGGIWSPTLWAFKPGSRVAFVEFKANLPAADEPVRLSLGPPASTPLRVVRPDGSPAAGARVRVVGTTLKAPRPPDGMLDRLAATTDADGRATIDGLAPADIVSLDVTAPGQVVQCLPLDAEAGTVALRPLGRLKVRVVADDPKAARGWSIKAWSRPAEPGYKGPYTTHWVSEDTGEDGRAELPPIARGQVLWEIRPPAGSNYLVAKEPATTIRAGETAEVEIPIRKAVRVEGVLREEPGGAPIPGVKLDLNPLRAGSRVVRWLVTDDQGRFSGLVTPGTIRFDFSLHDMPKGYFLPPGTPHWADFEVKEGEERHEFTPPRLRKGVLVRGKVVDDEGKPAAVVAVTGRWTSAEFGENPNQVRAETDARGEFVLGNIAPRSEIRVSAASGLVAESETLTIPSAGEGGPVTIPLKRRPTLALAGRVLGPDGKPLAGAVVRIQIRPADQTFNASEFTFEGGREVRTGPDGRFRTPAQIPVGNHYRVEARAPGCDPAESRWIFPPDLLVPDLTLRRSIASRAVSGRLVDSAGKPVAGAEVFQSGDGPSRTRGVTDADGRFRVPGVPDVPALLFVSASGYHFTGRRVEPGERSVDFALLRLDEPPAAPLRPAAPPVARDDERAIARALIADARKAPGTVQEVWEKREIPAITALIDPDRAVAMIENQVVTTEPDLLAAIAVGRFERDPRGAMETLDAIDSPETAALTALAVFDRLGSATPPAIRRELLDRAGRSAPAIEEPAQASRLLARVADRWLDLGDRDRGSALALKAQTVAKRPPPKPPAGVMTITVGDDGSRDDLALALARVDLAEAMKCLEGRDAQRFQLDTLRGGIARRIAATDPAGARRLLGQIEMSNRLPVRRAMCLAMAATDLPTARVVAANGRDPMIGVVLPAVAARARVESDPDGARALLRESVERLGQFDDDRAGWASPAVTLARLLPLIARIDPDRAPDAFWRALALRPPLPTEPERTPVPPQVRQHYLDLAHLAALAGRYDRAAAEVVFAPVAARVAGLDDDHWGLGAEGPAIFRAAGAFDARAAKSLLDALPEDPTPPPPSNVIRASDHRHHSKAQARIALARALGLPPTLRLHWPLQTYAVSEDWLDALDD